MQMEEQGEPGDEESGELGGDGAADSARGSEYCIWIKSSNGIMDYK